MNQREKDRIEGKDDIGSIDEADKGRRHHRHHHRHHRNKSPRIVFLSVLILGIASMVMGLILTAVCRSVACLAFTVDGFANFMIFCADFSIVNEKQRNVDEYTKKKRRALTNLFSTAGLLVCGTIVGCMAIFRVTTDTFSYFEVQKETLLLTCFLIITIIASLLYFIISKIESVVSKRLFHYLRVTIVDCIIILVGTLILEIADNLIVDATTAIAICLVMIYTVYKNFSYIITVVLNGANKDRYYTGLTREISALPGVKAVHHLHVWNYESGKSMLVCHVYTDELITDKFTEELVSMIKGICSDNNIDYECVQIERYEKGN